MAGRHRPIDPHVYQLKVSLRGSEPAIWRRILVPADFTLYQLHAVLQCAFDWRGEHLHAFVIRRSCYTLPDEDDVAPDHDESDVHLADVAGLGARFVYEYDFGDAWDHEVLVEKVTPADDHLVLPVCLDGERAAPPEDSGGVADYEEKLLILSDPTDPAYRAVIGELGRAFDPEAFDRGRVNEKLAKLRVRRRRPPARAASG